MNRVVIISIILLLSVIQSNAQSLSLSDQVCNETNAIYPTNDSTCACFLAEWVERHSYNETMYKCWNQFDCKYSNGKFCSDHGECDFQIGKCVCDDDWGSADCNEPYTVFKVSAVISVGMIIIACLLLLFSLSLMIWVHLYRDVGDVKAMSVVFTHLTMVGCAFVCIGAIFIADGFNDANCVILEWFQFFGICLIIGCALLKAYRIASIFGSNSFKPSDLTDQKLLKYLMFIMMIDILFLTIYTICNFVDGGAYYRSIESDLTREHRCNSNTLTQFSYSLLVAWQLLLLLFVLKYGNQTRSAAKIFKETKCIYVGSNIGSILFIAFGIFILFTTGYQLQIAIRGYGSLVVVSLVIYLLFSPKWKAVYMLKKQARQSNGSINDSKLTEGEQQMKNQYEANVKDPSGKELLLLLDALIKELEYRASLKMLSIELKDVDLVLCLELLENVKGLVPTQMLETKEQITIGSDEQMLATNDDDAQIAIGSDNETIQEDLHDLSDQP